MTPKEKAIELVEKMMLYSYEKIENEKDIKYIVDNKIKKEHAIQCALLTVDEILDTTIYYFDDSDYFVEYWQQVKFEINEL